MWGAGMFHPDSELLQFCSWGGIHLYCKETALVDKKFYFIPTQRCGTSVWGLTWCLNFFIHS